MSLPVYTSWDQKSKNFNLRFANTIDEFDCLAKQFLPRTKTLKLGDLEYSQEIGYLFRGVNNATFKMFSSIQRCVDYRKYPYRISLCSLLVEIFNRFHTEKNGFLNEEFLKQMPENTLKTHASKWAFIQHFGGPSPLLDFTSELEAALFFAFDKADLSIPKMPTGQMSEYVSVIIFPDNPTRIGEVTNMWADTAETATRMVQEHESKYGEIVDTDAFVREIHEQPLDQIAWGSIVYGNKKSYHSFRIPDADNSEALSAVDNINITAQMGSFLQGNLEYMLPLEDSRIIKEAGVERPYGTSIEIHKSIIGDIKAKYKIPTEEEVYPEKSGRLKPLYNIMESLWNPITEEVKE